MHSSPSFLPWPFRNDSLLAPRRYSIFQFLAVLTPGNVGTGGGGRTTGRDGLDGT
jgi:hypothetical protein